MRCTSKPQENYLLAFQIDSYEAKIKDKETESRWEAILHASSMYYEI